MVTPPPPREGQRIAKLLARAGIASRREIEAMIAEGRVALNGQTLTTPAILLPSLRGVTVDGNPVKEPAPARLFRYHKPPGLLTGARDPAGRPTIYDKLPRDLPRVMPVGRLDLNTEGLLLFTTDGELKRQLELPATGVPRTYRARAFGEISQEQLEALIEGITIDGVRYGSIDANLERRTGRNQWIELTLTEGKNREVRRVLEHFGLRVSRLIRTAYGPFLLGDLAPGEVDEVRRHDVVAFRNNPRAAAPAGLRHVAAPASGRSRHQSSARPAASGPKPSPRVSIPEGKLRPNTRTDAKPMRAPVPAAPADAAAEPAEKPARLKRGAGWAKPKPKPNQRPSSRPTRRGSISKRQPTKGRPGGNKQ
jgi:23S rRNA pseudouridine2605 synthase